MNSCVSARGRSDCEMRCRQTVVSELRPMGAARLGVGSAVSSHVVEFYETEEFLVDTVSGFIRTRVRIPPSPY